jgi:hypothetical protein
MSHCLKLGLPLSSQAAGSDNFRLDLRCGVVSVADVCVVEVVVTGADVGVSGVRVDVRVT